MKQIHTVYTREKYK